MQFGNYSGEKTPIQFQYPQGWNIEVSEYGSTIYTSIESPEKKSGISVCYGDQLMSTFGSSVFGAAMSESFGRHVGYYKQSKGVKVITKPTPVNIGGQDAAGSFVYKLKNKEIHETRIIQVWLIYIGIVESDVGGIGERGFEIAFSSTHFYDEEIIEIRDTLVNSIKFL